MPQATAVVLINDQSGRDEIRMRLSHCGVLPICFNDEWICLENIYHLRPTFAVLRPASNATALHFIHIASAVERSLPIIILSDQQALQPLLCKPWRANIFFLPYPVEQKDLQDLIESFGPAKLNALPPMVIAGSPAAQQCIDWLPLIGHSDEPVLIQGEPGVGKRLIAKAIHNCSAAKDTMLEFISAQDISGSWIGQVHQQIDRLSRSGPLVYVIENIEDLNYQMQSQLLLIMDALVGKGHGDGSWMPVRFIFLAEVDLSRLSRKGLFRKDLYHRLTVLKIKVPPLRERREDVPLLADFFAAKYGLEQQGSLVRLPEDIRTVFEAYHWPGNVAQLERTIKKALARGTTHWADTLQQWCNDHAGQQHGRFPPPAIDVDGCLQKLMDNKQEMSLKTATQRCAMQVEKGILKVALSRTHGNCKKAAILLNISYKSMLTKAKAYRLVGGVGAATGKNNFEF
jgi:DNA-binding NtrC family response regulator